LVKFGVLNEGDISDIFITDDVDAAYNFLVDKLTYQDTSTRDLMNSMSMNSILQA